MKKIYVTTPIYYVNDKPHIGHAYTTIAADVLARYFRQKLGKKNIFFLTGTDEHGAKVAQSAQKAGKTCQAFCDENCQSFKQAWQNLNISNDYFVRTTDEVHCQAVKKFMQKLYQQGDIYEGKYEGLYCTGCEKFLTEKDLVDGKCPYHKEPPKKVSEKNYFFKLKKYLPEVKKLIEQDKIEVLPKARKKEVLGLFAQGLADFSVSREKVEWGVPLPFDENQKVYVWVDALLNYISVLGYGSDQQRLEKWWTKGKIIHLMAKDILKFHAVYWPALLLAAGLKTPEIIFVHGFFSLDGQKMSKSLGNIIDPNDLVKKYGTDAARYLLLSQFTFGADGDIHADKFSEKYNADLANNLGNLVSRVIALNKKQKIKNKKHILKIKNLDKLYEEFKLKEILDEIWQQVDWANKYIEQKKLWELVKKRPAEAKKIIAELLSLIAEIGRALSPFFPETSEKIAQILKTNQAQPLFPRL